MKVSNKGEKMSDEFQILKKHLGDFEGVGEFQARQFCAQISDANDFIGALQVLDVALKKLENSLKETLNCAQSAENACFKMQDIVKNALFMGESLFDAHLSTRIGSQNFAFEMHNPLSMLENADFKGVLDDVKDKRGEISALFDELDSALEQDFIAQTPINSTFKDYTELAR